MNVYRLALSAVAALLLLLLPSTHAATPGTLVAVTANQTKLRIRLLDIDAPEVPHGRKPGQTFGEEARDYLDHLIGGKTVRVDAYGPDRYKRVLAVIWDDQINVNLLMVAMGYAEGYRGAPCQVDCRELEQAEAMARRDRVGMWALGEKYVSQVAFRKRTQLWGGYPQVERRLCLSETITSVPERSSWIPSGENILHWPSGLKRNPTKRDTYQFKDCMMRSCMMLA